MKPNFPRGLRGPILLIFRECVGEKRPLEGSFECLPLQTIHMHKPI